MAGVAILVIQQQHGERVPSFGRQAGVNHALVRDLEVGVADKPSGTSVRMERGVEHVRGLPRAQRDGSLRGRCQ